MTRILALDLGTRTGWASGPVGGDPRYGAQTIGKPGEEVGRFAHLFDAFLSDLITDEHPYVIVFESPILPRVTRPETVRKLMGLAWHTELVAYRRDIECREANIQQVKKFFAGYARADKSAMIAAAQGRGWKVFDDNIADALGIWSFAAHQILLNDPGGMWIKPDGKQNKS
jgi:crossover junction endodeoxyribonuclease RuvC